MMYSEPRLVLWLLRKSGHLPAIERAGHPFIHDWWINGLNYLLTFGPVFALIRVVLGPQGNVPATVSWFVAGSVVYGLMVAHMRKATRPRRRD